MVYYDRARMDVIMVKILNDIDKKLTDKINEENIKFINMYSEYECAKEFKKMNSSNGKHIRGKLVLLACLANNMPPSDNAYSLAVAMEFLQTAFLIQDDVIDRESERRGAQTVHISLQKSNNNNKIFNDTAAYILGTLGMTYASSLISFEDKETENIIKEMFFDMLFDTIQGESFDIVFPLIDMKMIGSPIETGERAELADSVAALKTSVYSFEAPLRMGNFLSGGNDAKDWFEKFGKELGIAFQMWNDLDALKKILKTGAENYMADVMPYRITALNAKAFEKDDGLFGLICRAQNDPSLKGNIQQIYWKHKDYLDEELTKSAYEHLNKAIHSLDDTNCPFKTKELLVKYLNDLFGV